MMQPARSRYLATLNVACLLLLSCSESLSTSQSGVDRIVVDPTSVSLVAGETRTTTAQVFDSDGQRIVDREVFWSSEDPAVATVSQSGVISAVASGNTQVAASAGGKSGIVSVLVTDRPVTLVRVLPSTASVQAGQTISLAAEALDASGAGVVGRPVSWETNRSSVATVSTSGVVTGVAPGTVTVTATIDGIEGAATITVSAVPAASVSVTPATGTLVQGGALQLAATVRDANGNALTGRAVMWSSSDESIATVSSTGRIVGIAEGSFTITATSGGSSGSGTYSVTRIPVGLVRLSPASVTIAAGQTQPLTVSLFASDKTTPLSLAGRTIAWSSSRSSTATVSSSGVVSGVAPGSATITAVVERITGAASVSVTSAPIATVSISPTTASVVEEGSTTLIATARDANGSVLAGRTFFWTSSNASHLSVSQSGVVTARMGSANESATITASAPGGGAGGSTPSASATVDATYAPVASVAVTPPSQTIQVGQTTPFIATLRASSGQVLSPSGRSVSWTSLNTAIATVNSTTGVVTGVAQGGPVTLEVSASSPGQGTPARATGQVTVTAAPASAVIVTPGSATVHAGGPYSRRFTAVATDAQGGVLGGRAFVWTSNSRATAIVDPNSGVVTGVTAGPVTITATTGSVSGSAAVSVDLAGVHRVVVTPSSATLDLANNQMQALTASPRDSANNPITGTALGGRSTSWHSSDAAVASVSSSGVVTPTGGGTATITATVDGTIGTSTITVTQAAVMTSISLAPAGDSLFDGSTIAFTATALAGALPLSGRRLEITSTRESVAEVSASALTTGASGSIAFTLESENVGTSLLTVSSQGGPSVSRAMRVLALAAGVTVSPSSRALVQGDVQPFTAVVTDDRNNPLSGRPVRWSSSNAAKLSIDPNSGLATARDSGLVTVIGTVTPGTGDDGVATGTSRITISLPPIASVSIAPATLSMRRNRTRSMTVHVRLNGGAAARGRACSLTPVDATVATVTPPSGITNQNGDLAATVTSGRRGDTDVRATCEGVVGATKVSVH